VRPTGWLLLATLVGSLGVALLASGLAQARPSLRAAVRHLGRPGRDRVTAPPAATGAFEVFRSFGAITLRHVPPGWVDRWRTPLRLIDRPVEVHVGMLVAAAIGGTALPFFALGALTTLGVASLQLFVPAGLALLTAICAPLTVQADAMNRAEEVRIDLRHQLSAYLDMVTMLLAGNTGHEGALAQAARAGDGRLFQELRRRMREVATTGQSLVAALALVAEEYDLDELAQVAATTSLSVAEGAPVARTLSAKCATLRSTLASEQEAAARIRTDKVTPPLVGMALLFMALIIYPALNLN
jgi:tight adherence protein C